MFWLHTAHAALSAEPTCPQLPRLQSESEYLETRRDEILAYQSLAFFGEAGAIRTGGRKGFPRLRFDRFAGRYCHFRQIEGSRGNIIVFRSAKVAPLAERTTGKHRGDCSRDPKRLRQ